MQFRPLAILALASFTLAQDLSEIGLVCSNLYTPDGRVKLDPTNSFIIESGPCEAIGGKIEANGIICCPKSNDNKDITPYNAPCNRLGGTVQWSTTFTGTKHEIVPAGWKCPK
ncbi:uncharacterized protein PG998_012188 [Apiospora kogelbergensis]|uniref:uncharacterized protein n=1 Tax=Apiospora kogelbergensis TaxID=1337665 RepID=UPI0031304927